MSLELSDELQKELARWNSKIGSADPYAGPTTLGIKEVLRAHFLLAEFFREEGRGLAGVGPRDLNLLHSALMRQQTQYSGIWKWDNKFLICATLFFGLIKDHPFLDGNKRTALLSLLYHLEKFTLCPTISKKEIEDFTVALAEPGGLDRYTWYKDLVKDGSADPEIYFTAHFLKRNTRQIRNSHPIVTFRELVPILNRHGFTLENPDNNKIEETREILGLFGKTRIVKKRIGSIPYPGPTKQVSHSDLKRLRALTRLDYKNNVDTTAFLGEADSLRSLITYYEEPLKRLADR